VVTATTSEQFSEALVHLLNSADLLQQEVIYGILSGFPLKAVRAFERYRIDVGSRRREIIFESVKDDMVPVRRFEKLRSQIYAMLRPNEVHPPEPNLIYQERYTSVGPPIPVLPVSPNGLLAPSFRMNLDSIDDPELIEKFSQESFVFKKLRVHETLLRIRFKAGQQRRLIDHYWYWKDNLRKKNEEPS
jgi:hypothetical protein